MATRIERLNRLRIASPCSESWDGMAGEVGHRHCAKCDRQVFDFARMTPRQIETRIEASGGRLCARLTRGAEGGLVTLPSPEPPPFWFERRASPVASALVTALLGFGGASAGAALEPPSAAATPSGPSAVSGFSPSAAVGSPKAQGTAVASVVAQMEPQVEEGGIILFSPAESLRQVYGESELVVAGVAGATHSTDPENPLEKEIEIRVTSVLKGRFTGRTLWVAMGQEDGEKPLAPGAKVLAFLEAGDPRPGRKVSYVATDLLRGPQALSDDQLAAYAARLDALGRISRRGTPGPEALAAWLVATVEQPQTRKEATGELSRALAKLAETAEERELSVDQTTADLRAEVAAREAEGEKFDDDEVLNRAGAFLTESDKNRLTRALLATESLSPGDLELYDIVHPWASDKALDWLDRRFREAEPEDGNVSRDAMGRMAEALDSDSLKALLKASDDEIESYFSSLSEESSNDTERVEAEFARRHKELRKRFLDML